MNVGGKKGLYEHNTFAEVKRLKGWLYKGYRLFGGYLLRKKDNRFERKKMVLWVNSSSVGGSK